MPGSAGGAAATVGAGAAAAVIDTGAGAGGAAVVEAGTTRAGAGPAAGTGVGGGSVDATAGRTGAGRRRRDDARGGRVRGGRRGQRAGGLESFEGLQARLDASGGLRERRLRLAARALVAGVRGGPERVEALGQLRERGLDGREVALERLVTSVLRRGVGRVALRRERLEVLREHLRERRQVAAQARHVVAKQRDGVGARLLLGGVAGDRDVEPLLHEQRGGGPGAEHAEDRHHPYELQERACHVTPPGSDRGGC